MNIRLTQLFQKTIEERILLKAKIQEIKKAQKENFIPIDPFIVTKDEHFDFLMSEINQLYINKWVSIDGDFGVVINTYYTDKKTTEMSEILLYLATNEKAFLTQQRIQFILNHIEFRIQKRTSNEISIVRRYDFKMEHSNHASWHISHINTCIHYAQILLEGQI